MKKEFFVSNQSACTLTYDMVKAFAKSGREVVLLSGRNAGPDLPKEVKFVKICTYDKSSSFLRIYTWLKGAFDLFRIFRKHPNAELFIISNPPVAPLLPLFFKNEFSLLVWDIWPDALVHTGTLSSKNLLVRGWRALNRKVFPRAKRIFTISDGLADALSNYAPREKFVVIPNWADIEFLHPIPKEDNPFVKEHGLQGKFVVMYSGNIGNTHPVEKLVDIAAKLESIAPDLVFMIIGEGGRKEIVLQRIRELKVKNVRVLPYQPYSMLPYSLAAADIAVITLEEAASQVSVPSKTYSMLAVGAPLLCLAGKNSELANLVNHYNVGEIFSPSDIDLATNWILELRNSPEKHRAFSTRAREASFNFTPKNAEKYAEALNLKKEQ